MSTTRADLLIMAAHAPELLGLRSALGPTLSGKIGRLRVDCAAVGVGLAVAGGGTMRHVRDAKPRAVLLVGSCGLYPHVPFHALLPVVPEGIRLVDPSVLNEEAAFPAPMQLSIEPHAELAAGLAGVEHDVMRGQLACTLSITTNDALAKRIGGQSGCAAENLEAFSVGLACAALELPFAAVLITTNEVGSEGRKQWLEHQRHAAERGAQLLLTWIDRGAPGLPKRRASRRP